MNNVQVHYDVAEERGSGASFLPYLPSIIWQRKWLLIIPSLLALIAALATAFLLPTKYQSRAVLLVEAPLLPGDVAGGDPSGAEVVDSRMARIRQQVLSRPQLIELIQRNSLYQTELRSSSLSEVIEKMRGSIAIEPVTADIQSTSSGRRSTIAFGMSFFYSDPIKAQAVAQALTEQVLQIDASKSAAQAVNTVEFLTDQATDLQTQISQLESALAQVKAQNGLALSPSLGMYAGGSSGGIDGQIAALQAANAQLIAQRDMTKNGADRDPVVAQAEQALAAAQAAYSDKHPDVILAKQRLAEAKELAKSNVTRVPMNALDAQLASNNKQIAILQAAKGSETSRSQTIMNAQMRAPLVQQQVSQLQERLDGLNAQYQRVQNQLLSAKAGKKAEDEQQGERLSVIDPPVIPDEPVSPNRPMIITMITGAGIGLGLAVILFIELLMKPIRDAGAIVAATGEAPLVVIPTILTKGERQKKGLKSLWPFGGGDDDDDEDDDEPVRARVKK
ncbi:GumC family protein [Sphingobium nicotianae]|uniref:Lipopolysaccharide biosynthesis protein n=1 Tax=Sphingobium nicotianae TaxID=2782607 RepID=A0A9X1DF77_9SPHN|nr:Wzz/FepE/Etk N-terminal domain-containing protein [Sphingobium nicotianae]MBT2188951.1 lipopolysaccharide biosynthesis protein [Sphingobium nicotianae]